MLGLILVAGLHDGHPNDNSGGAFFVVFVDNSEVNDVSVVVVVDVDIDVPLAGDRRRRRRRQTSTLRDALVDVGDAVVTHVVV